MSNPARSCRGSSLRLRVALPLPPPLDDEAGAHAEPLTADWATAVDIFADSAITAIVNPTVNSGGVVSFSNTAESGSPARSAPIASPMRFQIDITSVLLTFPPVGANDFVFE